MRWLRDQLGFINSSAESEKCASKVSDNGGVYLIPAFSGLGAPYWDMKATGMVVGLTAGSGKNHIIRAALESIAFQSEDVIAAMNEDIKAFSNQGLSGSTICSLRVDGGASANNLLMQMQSDISDIEVIRPASAEATALGAAFLAGLGVGFYKDREELMSLSSSNNTCFLPQITADEKNKRIFEWHRAIKACRAYSEEE